MSTLVKLVAAFLLCLRAAGAYAQPAQSALTVTAGAVTNHFTVAELLSRSDLASIQIPPGVDYDVQLTVQAVPLLDLLAAFPLERFDRLEATATDGFVAQIPLALIEAGKSGGSVAWVAVEDPSSSLAQAAGERHQRRPVLFGLAISRTIPGGERTMAVYAGKAHGRAVPRSSLAAAYSKCDAADRRPGEVRRNHLRHPVSPVSSPERRRRVRDRPGPRSAHGGDRIHDRAGAPRFGARSEIGKNLATTANAGVFPDDTARRRSRSLDRVPEADRQPARSMKITRLTRSTSPTVGYLKHMINVSPRPSRNGRDLRSDGRPPWPRRTGTSDQLPGASGASRCPLGTVIATAS